MRGDPRTDAYKALLAKDETGKRLVRLSVSTVATLLDYSTLPEDAKQKFIDEVVKQLRESE